MCLITGNRFLFWCQVHQNIKILQKPEIYQKNKDTSEEKKQTIMLYNIAI